MTTTDRCTRCNEILNPTRIKWLELSWKTGKYNDPEIKLLPEEESQGCFPFGRACAKTQLREQSMNDTAINLVIFDRCNDDKRRYHTP